MCLLQVALHVEVMVAPANGDEANTTHVFSIVDDEEDDKGEE